MHMVKQISKQRNVLSTQSVMNIRPVVRDCLRTINEYRRRHNLHELIYEEELEVTANEWAKVLCRIDKVATSLYSGIRYGEDVILKRRAMNNLTGWEIATTWYVEGYNFMYGIEGQTSVNHQFTQLIWASTREFGLGIVFNEEEDAFIVGHFRQLGNITGVFKFNVFPGCAHLQPSQPTLEEMNIIGLRTHNIYRKRHGCSPMILCHDLIASAQKWADFLAPHRGTILYAKCCSITETIATYFDPLGFICSRKVSDQWYATGKGYDYIHYKPGTVTDAFTHMIWNSTTEVGFGRSSCDGHHYLVAHYRLPTHISSHTDNIFGLSEEFM